jgi:hypothetical protein
LDFEYVLNEATEINKEAFNVRLPCTLYIEDCPIVPGDLLGWVVVLSLAFQ